ncbi:uncharacterized protein LAESUDRAFT_302553 [Laetiporus sulphureus 93-53]|uniref:Uncharacterized protein n=1 Tax=Laetiporus sulphureus 93-53 TaxID=1314785 RepID=A0A165D7G8_9APHY|nr:uncharacterized protein LAESUDRAFT_302553 [Laetiporus sulphureus 93-53]KZT04278.1 hypothetical protein LAESUDRAFT_302553 [Laetiporus sulphureus 93-53]
MSHISFQRTPWPRATTPFRCLDKRSDRPHQHQAGQTVLALKATAALNWLGSMKEAIAKRASHTPTAADSGHEKSTGHVQATPTPICSGSHHPLRLPSASPLHLPSRTRSQDDNTSDKRRYLSTSIRHELAARNSSSISDTAAKQENRDVGLSITTRPFDNSEAAAGKILGEADEAKGNTLNQLLGAMGE